ncbi:MAG: DUF5658 family protein [Nannocystaceae bacterium]|nr:DUF5658 family protein [bacterium]
MHASASPDRVLWVGEDPPDASPHLTFVVETDPGVACERARAESWSAVVVEGGDPEAVRDVLAAAREGGRGGCRIAAASYEELPTLVRVVDDGVIERVLARPVEAAQLARTLHGESPSESVVARRALNAPEALSDAAVDERLRQVVARIVDIPTAVIRPIAQSETVPAVQLVVPVTEALLELQRDFPRLLGWPLKARGSATGITYRKHPVRKILGDVSESQEVYCLGRDNFAYVACFPWAGGEKITVVIGVHDPTSGRVEALQQHAIAQALEFPLPSRHRKSPLLFYDPDYDWVITKNYVGPDRRRTRTPFLNRYAFRGRRKELIPNEFRTAGAFVDHAPRWAWIGALLFMALFTFDTVMTAVSVGEGSVAELNPAMRWALQKGLTVFLTSKTLLAVGVVVVLLRWHLWRPGRWIFAACLAIYLAIDINWLMLMATGAV